MKIPKSESKTVEFKTAFNQDAIVSLVAFANSDGGSVYVGVRDDGRVVGVQLADESETSWVNEIKSKTAPAIVPDAERIVVKGKTIVRLHISPLPVKPTSVQGRYYLRKGKANHLMSIAELGDMYLKSMSSSPRNPKIADVFKDAGLVERYGSGIKRIIDACKAHGKVVPEFKDMGTWFRVILRKESSETPVEAENVSLKTPQKGSLKTPQKILAAIRQNPSVGTQEMADLIGVERSTVARAIAKLKSSGRLRRVGPDKGGYWEALGGTK